MKKAEMAACSAWTQPNSLLQQLSVNKLVTTEASGTGNIPLPVCRVNQEPLCSSPVLDEVNTVELRKANRTSLRLHRLCLSWLSHLNFCWSADRLWPAELGMVFFGARRLCHNYFLVSLPVCMLIYFVWFFSSECSTESRTGLRWRRRTGTVPGPEVAQKLTASRPPGGSTWQRVILTSSQLLALLQTTNLVFSC